LLTVVYEPLARIQKEGELGRRKITQWTRYMTVILGALQSIGIAAILTKQGLVLNPGIGFILMTVLTLTTGTAFIMWLGEQITDRGIGNGMSLLIFTGIVAGLPRGVAICTRRSRPTPGARFTILVVLLLVAAWRGGGLHRLCGAQRAAHSHPERAAHRRPAHDGRPIQPSAAEGELRRRDAGHLRQLDSLGAHALRPGGVGAEQPLPAAHHAGAAPGYPWYELLYMLGIIFFAYFYVSIVMKPDDIADNFRKSGSFIPGIRPGKRTSDFINDILTRITLVGALYLILISLVPTFLISGIRFDKIWLIGRFFENLPNWMIHGMGVNFYFGGTSLLIVVGVAMDTVNQIESQLIMRHYDGFSPRSGRIRGRKTW
jgi:preprotein translocase subunit SecY